MIKIHSTKKLLAKLPPLYGNGILINSRVNADARATDDSPLGSWHANLLTLQRHNCILFVHDATRFPVLLKELRKSDFAELAWHFEDGFMNTILKAGADDAQMQAAADALRPLQFDNDCNRSVLGTMNQMAGDVEHMLWYDNASLKDISAYRTGAWLADRPCTVKGVKDCIWPPKAMFSLLDKLSKNSKVDSKHADTDVKAPYDGAGNVVSIEKFRK